MLDPVRRLVPWLLSAAVLGLATAAHAQWPTTSSPNLPVGDGPGEQTLVKLAPTSDGGCYLGWFDSRSGGYAVYLQRLDAAGVEQWPHGGLLVSGGNPQSSSLVDWDLLCDRQDHCVLTFTDTRAGGDLDVYAYRITPNGTFVWGANGLTLSNNADYEPDPRVVEAPDGDFVFAWQNTVARTLQLQRVTPAGSLQFPGDGLAIPGETGATPGFVRLVAGAPGTGDVILSWVRTLSFTGNKHVHAQKFDAAGNALWNGGTRLAVFDQASVPIAHAPRLVADGLGGAVVAWHFALGNQFAVRVQRLTAAGAEAFVHNGVDVSASANSKFDPALVWLPPAAVMVAWNERNVAQTTWGLFAQQLDATGTPAFGATGLTLLPIDTTVKFAPVAAPLRQHALADGMAVGVLVESLGLQQKSVQVFGVTSTGTAAFPPVTASSFASDKLRLAIAASPSGSQLLAWTDQRSAADVYAAAFDARGSLGVGVGVATLGGCGGNPAGSLTVVGRPAIGTTTQLLLTNPLASQAAGSLGFFALGVGGLAFPCGVAVPGFGMSPGTPGEVVVDLAQPAVLLLGDAGGLWNGTAPVAFGLAVPFDPNLLGTTLYAQGLLVDLTTPNPAVPFGLANGVRLTIGS